MGIRWDEICFETAAKLTAKKDYGRLVKMIVFQDLPRNGYGKCAESTSWPHGGGGFTMVELLIVVVIIAIAAAVAVPLASSAAGMQIKSAANMMAADLEYAKSMAISRAQNYSVVFDAGTESYRIEDQNGSVIKHPVKKGFDYVVDFRNEARLRKVEIVNADFDTTGEVKFDYLGSPYNGSNNPLNQGVVTLQAGSTTLRVNVEPVTGFISIGN